MSLRRTGRLCWAYRAVGIAWGLSLVASAWAAGPVDSVALIEAREFLDDYQASSNIASPGFYDLYSDRAVIHARIDGRKLGVVFGGRAYKTWGRQLAQSRQASPDASEFHEALVEQRGSRLMIHAKRYSLAHCFWDSEYQVSLEKESTSYRIVDERLTTNPAGTCPPTSSTVSVAPPALGTALRESRQIAGQPRWRPLSQSEIAESAWHLAEEAAAKSPSQGRLPAAPSAAVGALPGSTKRRAPEPLSALWVTPEN